MGKGWALAKSWARLAKRERTGLGCAGKGMRAGLGLEIPGHLWAC